MKKNYRSLILMLTFLTRIPFPMSFEFNKEDYARGIFYFPVIGALIGGLLLPLILIQPYVPERIFPFISIILYVCIVGGIHIDGIGDLFDGIFSARDQKRMLEIMSDSHIGAFGVVGMILYFLGMYVGLLEVAQLEEFALILFCMPLVGRSIALISAGFSRYAKDDGLGKAVVDRVKPKDAIVVAIFLVGICIWFAPMIGLSVGMTLMLMLFITWRIHRILDGITGDVLGALVEISQVIFVIVTSILIRI